MAETQRMTTYGRYPSCANSYRIEARRYRRRVRIMDRNRRSDRIDNFVSYDSSDDEEEPELDKKQFLRTSFNSVDYIRSRETNTRDIRKFDPQFGTRHILSHELLKEYSIGLNKMNKVFCSQWLSDRQVVFGTKCNKLMVYDVTKQNFVQIPLLQGQCIRSANNLQPVPFGIHSVEINPSRTLLATGAHNSREIAVYRLPTLDPVCLGIQGHRDWVYDMCWLDDEFLVSGSRDAKLALWRIDSDLSKEPDGEDAVPSHSVIEPVLVRKEKSAQSIRSLLFNKAYKEIAVLSTDSYIHVWSAETFKQKLSRKLPTGQENKDVCLAVNEDGLYAVGCKSCTLLLDARTLLPIKKVQSRNGRGYIRSASFQDSLLTIGSGYGNLEFYDVKAQKYLESSVNANRNVVLKNASGRLFPEENISGEGVECTPAIFTHCYDPSGMRLFCAGGPIESHFYGNYAGLWQ